MDDPRQRAGRLASALMSPFCPGKTLDACPSPRAGQWREEMRGWAADGASDQEILARLQQRVPDFDLLGRPGARWDWALPVGAMGVASLVLWIVARRMRRKRETGPQAEAAAAQLAPEQDRRLEAELALLEEG